MKNKKIIFIFISIITIILITYLIKINSSPSKNVNVQSSNGFLKCSGYIAAQEEEKYIINLIYFYTIDNELNDNIESIEFVNANQIKSESIKINDKVKVDEYNLNSLALNIFFTKKGIYKINQVKVKHQNGKTYTYDIGNLVIDVREKENKKEEYLRVGNRYPVIRTNFNSYVYAVNNETNEDIIINNIDFNINAVDFNFKPTVIKAKSSLEDEIKFNYTGTDYSYYLIRPRIEYKFNDSIFNFYPPLTYYDLISINKSQIEKSIKK